MGNCIHRPNLTKLRYIDIHDVKIEVINQYYNPRVKFKISVVKNKDRWIIQCYLDCINLALEDINISVIVDHVLDGIVMRKHSIEAECISINPLTYTIDITDVLLSNIDNNHTHIVHIEHNSVYVNPVNVNIRSNIV
jgi:hypothetical protein